MVKLNRRNFLKSLLATAGAAILAPQALIEPFHGASDLTPRERDIAAEMMGLRQEQWAGWTREPRGILGPAGIRAAWAQTSSETLTRPDLIPLQMEHEAFGEPYQDIGFGGPVEITITGTYGEGASAAFASLSAEAANKQEGEIVVRWNPSGRVSAARVVSLPRIVIGPGTTIVGRDSAERPSFSFPGMIEDHA